MFLVGGFGASPYLQEMLFKSLKLRNIKMRRPDGDKSWTAVVRGAVIYGVEYVYQTASLRAVEPVVGHFVCKDASLLILDIRKARHKDATYISGLAKSYGVVLSDGRFEWLTRRNDVVRSNCKRTIDSGEFWIPATDFSKAGSPYLSVFSYGRKGDDDDDAPQRWHDGQSGKFIGCGFATG